jgi:hypothetical protein
MGRSLGELSGQRFGRLVVLGIADKMRRGIHWLCQCDCGSRRAIFGTHLVSGHTQSCGCIAHTHGHSIGGRTSRTYNTWRAMIVRCTDPKAIGWMNYGGRGVTVCERCMVFGNFLEDMGERPKGKTIDRIDNNLLVDSYSKSNCRWATLWEQRRGRRDSKLTPQLVQEIHGRCEHGETQRSVVRRMGVSPKTISSIRKGTLWPDQLHGYPYP